MIDKLPDGWRVEKLGDIGKVFTGSSAPQDTKYFENGNYPFVRVSDLSDKKFNNNLQDIRDYINDICLDETKQTFAKSGTILFAKSGMSVKNNHRAILGRDAYIVSHLCAIYLENEITRKFVYQLLCKMDMVNFSDNDSYPSLKTSIIKLISIPIPPLPQQAKIVKVLDISSALIDKQKKLIKNYDLFLKSKFIEMFGDPIKNPMEWEVEKLENLGKWKGGGTPSRQNPEYFKGNIPWITTTSLGKLYIDRKNAVEFITNEAIQNSATKIIPINSIIIGTRVGVGKVSINTEELCSNQDIMSLTNITDNVIPIYIFYFIHFYKKVLKSQQRGATIQGITAPVLKQLNISIPPITLQNKFASIVEKTELIKEKENKKLKSLQTLHDSLMQKAFKGEIG
ncbi:hypothetical protein M947_01070 [Sulfurimonas hongkongensis]|uniref:Type I restriction modification DNA specificity domain-containing protein n=1 Tax=Sulfurimonas hongkongensis TaxID=1172190 RepID=T0JTT8_9BACT|nr:restriction endonuclease subunit S [Sulfurimonas hongkongensis]EQB40417.1 hypothetical protein M947_01070 [Sulfurimonas hongkongensis]